jgi:hypothetical protein
MPAGQEAPEAFRLLAGTVDPAVERLRADGAQAGLDPEAQPPCDLFRRPAFGQPVRDVGRELRVRLQGRLALTAQQVRPVRHVRPVRPAVERVAPELAGDGRRRPPERPGDRPKRQTGSLQIGDPITLLGPDVAIS